MGVHNPQPFFDAIRRAAPLGPSLSPDEVSGVTLVLNAAEGLPAPWAAYMLATAVHETAGTLRPIREYGKGAGRPYGKPGAHHGQVPYGRGLVQITWDANYEKADRELALNGALLANFDLALDPVIAARIMRRGMEEGWFTGRSLADFLPRDRPASREEFALARKIINGRDRAELIATYAQTFQSALIAGGWA